MERGTTNGEKNILAEVRSQEFHYNFEGICNHIYMMQLDLSPSVYLAKSTHSTIVDMVIMSKSQIYCLLLHERSQRKNNHKKLAMFY